ncbi:translation initiation factor IF-2-like [Pteropus medius]|uniref:translation initiation factor IF-2-like n=1 Tax=Pteropus vampyrus TaxID=132908 RepID=UPI00196AAEA2|nr:translation initiation factor IF-2-like [Pteropus giganteus]
MELGTRDNVKGKFAQLSSGWTYTQKRSAAKEGEREAGRSRSCPSATVPGRQSHKRGPYSPSGRRDLAPTSLARTPGRRREAAGQELGCGHLGPVAAERSREFRGQQVAHGRGLRGPRSSPSVPSGHPASPIAHPRPARLRGRVPDPRPGPRAAPAPSAGPALFVNKPVTWPRRPAPRPLRPRPPRGPRARPRGVEPEEPRDGSPAPRARADSAPRAHARPALAHPAAGCAVRPAPGSARRGAQQRGTPGGSGLRAPGALLKPQSPPLPPPPRRIPPGRGRGPPADGRAPAPIPSAQHIATRRGLARHGRSPSAPSQSAEDGTPPPASPTSHPPPPALAGLGCGEGSERRL